MLNTKKIFRFILALAAILAAIGVWHFKWQTSTGHSEPNTTASASRATAVSAPTGPGASDSDDANSSDDAPIAELHGKDFTAIVSRNGNPLYKNLAIELKDGGAINDLGHLTGNNAKLKNELFSKNKLAELFSHNDPVLKFKQRINFDHLVCKEDTHTRVCANWRQLGLISVAQGLNVTGPVTSVSTLAFDKGQERFAWELSNGANMVSVEVVDALTAVGARKLLLSNAEHNSMVDIPFEKGPENLGTVSAISKDDGADYTQLFWVYRNMYFEINVRGKFDRLRLARFLQEYAEANLKPVES